MDADYPEHLLAREPAPPYEGEGPFALWHFSEDPSLGWFRPHTPATNADARPLVWAVDTRHAPMFWFPRDCPRGCIWPVQATTAQDRERFFGGQACRRRDRASGHAVHLAVLAAGCELDRRVQRLPSGQQHPAPGPVRVALGLEHPKAETVRPRGANSTSSVIWMNLNRWREPPSAPSGRSSPGRKPKDS